MNELPPTLSQAADLDGQLLALFGQALPSDLPVQVECMHQLQQADRELALWQVRVGKLLNWTLTLVSPLSRDQVPILLSGDGCWPQVIHGKGIQAVLNEGCALAWFNRTELAFDNGQRKGPIWAQWPSLSTGCISAWAWGYQRSLDALVQIRQAHRPDQIQAALGLVGHSRGGKAALLAAATDQRAAAVISHNSGTAGAASLAVQRQGAESLTELIKSFPHWLSPELNTTVHIQNIVALDTPRQMLATIAPRGLCLLQAKDDLWANPEGTECMHQMLKASWAGHEANLKWVERPGGHAMTPADWQQAAKFLAGF